MAPHTLSLGVLFDQGQGVRVAPGELHIAGGLLVDREDPACRAVLGCHIANGGPVGKRQVGEAVAEELDELPDHALLAQHLRNGEYQVRGRGTLAHLPGQSEPDNLRQQHGDGLAEHGGLGLDAADAPAQNPQAVDHGGVGIGTDQRVRIGEGLAVVVGLGQHALGQILQIDLMDDAGTRRHDPEVIESLLPPAQELIALLVALELDLGIEIQGVGDAVMIHHHRVIDDQVDLFHGINLLRIPAELLHGVAHGRQIDYSGHARKVLEHDARRREGDLLTRLCLGVPVENGLDMLAGNVLAVLLAQKVL